MARNRTDFNDSQKAEIFRRDRATCCFSGANLWLLDAPLRQGWETDWADHRLPASKGGESEIHNGVCASATFNFKKRNNTADTVYLFEAGLPTAINLALFGPPSAQTRERLQRLSVLHASDWYFNRMLCWILQALQYVCWSSEWDLLPTRNDHYWLKAAYKKLLEHQKLSASLPSMEERGLIPKPTKLQAHLLSLRWADSFDSFRKGAMKLSPQFTMNSKMWNEYFHPEDGYVNNPSLYDRHRKKAYSKACKRRDLLCPDTFNCIQSDFSLRFGQELVSKHGRRES